MKAFASAMLVICAVGFSSTIATAQTHPLVGKWQRPPANTLANHM
jgi:hypothetical protein